MIHKPGFQDLKSLVIQTRPELADADDAPPLSMHLRIAGSLLLIALVLATFSPLASGKFLRWDDFQTIAGNPSLNPVSSTALAAFWSHEAMDLYVAVTYTFWSILAAISPRHAPDADGFTLSPAVFHLASLFLHAIASIVVWRMPGAAGTA